MLLEGAMASKHDAPPYRGRPAALVTLWPAGAGDAAASPIEGAVESDVEAFAAAIGAIAIEKHVRWRLYDVLSQYATTAPRGLHWP
jgi:hypothetical protein